MTPKFTPEAQAMPQGHVGRGRNHLLGLYIRHFFPDLIPSSGFTPISHTSASI